ncbi:MAG: fructose-6-phosphate aldolase [Proteobacteria bacterium]|nr:fructose-6-phosphate aldolase [Cystobacterineae bacterium]MCL2258870.1 fructose-6-phosphate aldolase [Cystobacterineae bacterium]MCL2314478.1 fructose-6-phosphate aldolase [Pseudomonadota bacterium]
MKFFVDSADTREIQIAVEMGCIDGVTTNPSLLAKVGRPLEATIREIAALIDGPISAECISTQAEAMVKEGVALSALHPNVVVKIPMGVEGLKATRALAGKGIATNVTLVFSPLQALLCAKAGASFVSPFVGRLDDIGQEGMEMVRQTVAIFDNYGFATEVLVASVRNPIHVLHAALAGAHVATLPLAVLKQLSEHPLTTLGIERFLADWEKVPKA